MGLLIDSSIIIWHERGRVDLDAKLRAREDEQAYISAITASELLHGVYRARDAGARARRSAFVERVLQGLPVLGIELATARTHAQLGADLSAAGTPIGPHDLWIAATAVTHGFALATANVREFGRVPGLTVESWTTE